MTYQIRHAMRVLGIGGLFALLGCGDLSGASLWAQGGTPQKHKVLVCHIPQGNMENAHEIWIAESAVPAHLDHGDLLGACPMVFACTEQGIRDAIDEGGGPHYFDCDGPTVVPTVAEIVIDNDVILDGEGDLIVDAGGAVSVEAGDVAPKVNGAHRVFSIPEGVTAELIGFTVTGGANVEQGGGIQNAGALMLTACIVSGNSADVGGAGVNNLGTGTLTVADSAVSGNTSGRFSAGIRNLGEAEVINTTVSNNSAVEAGGGVSNRPGGTMTLISSAVQGNSAAVFSAGGVSNAGELTLIDTTASNNTAGSNGGGIRNLDVGKLTMIDCTVSSNSAVGDGGGILNEGTLVLTGGAVSGNTAVQFGGGVWNPAGGSASLENTTVSFNSGLYGGGIANREGSMALVGTTVYGNTATGLGGGIYNEAATLTMIDGDVSRNTTLTAQGGGILNAGGASANLQNTTVSFNSSFFGGGGISNDSLGTTMVLIGATVQGNTAIADGGGINNGGTLRVVDSVVAANTSDNFGGGIANSGNITVINTTLSENTATTDGGGIGNSTGGTAELSETTFSLNSASIYGGGISNRPDANMTLTGIKVHGNTAEAEGAGGVANAGTMTMRKSIVSSNSAPEDGGGILNTETGAITLMTTTVTENSAGTWGGGIRNFGAMDIMDTTVSDNTAQGGAGISNRPGAWMALTNSTVSGNEGSGISNWSTLTLASVTVSGNRIFNDGGWITARNTIVDSHCAATPLVDSLGGNIESPGNTCGFGHPADQVDVTPAELALDSLQDNGGPTWTHALLPGSFAIDSVVECVNPWGFPLFVDQRGASRPHGPACDAGSFELGGVLLPQDQCVNDADRNTYESLVYINSDGYLVTCISAAAEMATDCIFGSAQSSPPIVGCPAQAAAVIACYPSCPSETFEAFGDCVASCTTEVTGLSAECAGCYGALAECAAQVCLVECAGDPDSPECDLCRSQSRCNMIYDGCSGLPGSTDCSTGGTPLEYTQDFESLDQMSPTALSDDGWLVFGQVVDADGVPKFGYGPFPAPNGTPGFSSIVTGEGGPDQGAQQLVVYNDYNCCDPNQGHRNGTDRVTSLVFQEPFTLGNPISADDVGKTLEFSFDARRGNINDPTGSSTALAFIQTLDPNAGFAQTNFVSVDMTNLPAGTWDRYSISLTIDAGLVGQYLEFGFSSTASNFDPSGVFYDNILVVL